MNVIDEYLATRVVAGEWPEGLPDDQEVGITTFRWYRLLQRIYDPGTGQLSQALATMSERARQGIRSPHPEVLTVIDSRLILNDAAAIAAAHRVSGLLVTETLGAAIAHGRRLWFGPERNVGRRLEEASSELGIEVHVLGW